MKARPTLDLRRREKRRCILQRSDSLAVENIWQLDTSASEYREAKLLACSLFCQVSKIRVVDVMFLTLRIMIPVFAFKNDPIRKQFSGVSPKYTSSNIPLIVLSTTSFGVLFSKRISMVFCWPLTTSANAFIQLWWYGSKERATHWRTGYQGMNLLLSQLAPRA